MINAEKEVLKMIEEMGMIPGLRAANVVYQNQRTREITMLNSASSAFVSDTSIFPDEQNIAMFEELFDLDNNILLGNLQKDSTATVEQITEIIADAQGTEKEEEEELDEGDPRNCELYKVGTCKFIQRGFVEPAMTHWIGCEFPNCGKWWHELCLGIKFQNDEKRNRYAFIICAPSMTATQLNYLVLKNQRQQKRTNQFSMEAVMPSHKLVTKRGKGKNNIGREIMSSTWNIKAKCTTFQTFFLFK